MSQPPIFFESPPVPPPRPTVLTVLAIIGIVFGGLGVLCLGFGDIVNLLVLASPALAQSLNQAPGQRAANLILSTLGLIFSGVLLATSIGSINLKPAARLWMIRWAAADIVYDLIKLVVTLLVLLPKMSNNPAFQQNAMGPQMVTWAKVSGAVSALVIWAVTTTYAAIVFVYFRKPEIVSAFENPPLDPNPGTSLPIPPM